MPGQKKDGTATATPLPGRPVRGSGSGRPVMALLDLLGRRWALRILWELRDAPMGFRALQAVCDGMSASVLATRLREMEAAALVARDDGATWGLTPAGRDLLRLLMPLERWSRDWADSLERSADRRERS